MIAATAVSLMVWSRASAQLRKRTGKGGATFHVFRHFFSTPIPDDLHVMMLLLEETQPLCFVQPPPRLPPLLRVNRA